MGDDVRCESCEVLELELKRTQEALKLVMAAQMPGSKGSGSSDKAAKASQMRCGSQRHELLKTYADNDQTDWEAALACGLTGSEYWARCSDLRSQGLLEFTGEERPSGRSRMLRSVCRITDAGTAALLALDQGVEA